MKPAIWIAAVSLLAAATVSLAGSGGQRQSAGSSPADLLIRNPHRIDALNNVITMNDDGSRRALCTCGREFAVDAQSASVERGGTQLLLCSQGCMDKWSLASDQGRDSTYEAWKTLFGAKPLLSNARVTRGREMATCTCGKTFEVNSRTLAVVENGIVVHFCSKACSEKLRAKTAEARMQTELAMLPAARHEAHPAAEVIYRGPNGAWRAHGVVSSTADGK